MSEKLIHDKIPAWKGILVTLAIVAGLGIISFVTSYITFVLNNYFHIENAIYGALPTIAVFLFVVIVAVVIVKKRMQDYIYTADKGKFIVERKMGSNEKMLVDTPLSQIAWIGEVADIPEDFSGSRSRLTFKKNNESKALIYRDGAKTNRAVIFTPSDKFMAELKMRVEKARKKAEEKASQQEQSDEE